MIKLLELHIQGFKDSQREILINFSNEPISVIYGENGSGKTTLLKIIHAILSKDENILIQENVKKISIKFQVNKEIKNAIIEIEKEKVNWGNIKSLYNSTSILFGVNRGMILPNNEFLSRNLRPLLNEFRFRLRRFNMERIEYDLFRELDMLLDRALFESGEYSQETSIISDKKHIAAESIQIRDIEKAIIQQFKNGEIAASEKVKNAFFNTVAKAVDIELEKEKKYDLPKDFWERFDKKRDFLLKVMKSLDNSQLQKNVITLLEKGEKTNILESKIFKALLVNILEKAEEDNIELIAINKLIEIFNSRLYRNKKLVVTAKKTYIDLGYKNEHDLDKLSSGERHLLSFLTLFLIIGKGRNFFLIDEPEISLNMIWQRELLPLLNKLSPQSQIIVATHSPSISEQNTNYLVELI